MVRPFGFRRATFVGPTAGDEGAERGCDVSTADAVEMVGRGAEEVFMLSERFFMFRGFLPGDSGPCGRLGSGFETGRCNSSSGGLSCPSIFMDLNGDKGTTEVGDSGDELGEGSVIEDESKVDMVVVGEESVDAELTEVTLSRC